MGIIVEKYVKKMGDISDRLSSGVVTREDYDYLVRLKEYGYLVPDTLLKKVASATESNTTSAKDGYDREVF